MIAAAPSGLPDPAQSRVLLVGFARYNHAPDLPAITNNLDALQDFFVSNAGWGLPAEHCQVVSQAATADDVIGPLRSAAQAARDTLFVYYAGHGILDEDMEFSLSLPHSRLNEPWTGVSYTWLRRFIGRARARRRVAVLDSCFSGKAHAAMGDTSAAVKAQAAAAGTVVITSARDDRVALAPVGETYTAFTGELLTVLREGIEGGPAIITVDQVYEAVKQALSMKGRPRPDRTGSDTSGHTGIAVNRAFVADVPAREPRAPARQHLRGLVARMQADHSDRTGRAVAAPPPKTSEVPTSARAEKRPRSRIFKNPASMKQTDRPRVGPRLNGRYQLTQQLAVGGMGEVWLCHDTLLGRIVAVKRVRNASSDRESQHLREEARAAAALNHPSIAAVYDVVEGTTGQYMVMEFVRGWELGTVTEEAQPTVQESLAMVLDVLDGLEHSHTAGIIHCDIKPSNLILTPQGRVKILDFGISSVNEAIHQNDGTIVGTLLYMPPESLSGAAPHVTRDIFSTGAVLYELITGHRVYQSDTYPPPRSAWAQPPTPPSVLVPGLDPGVEALIEKALAPQPAMRYPSAAQMRADVERYL